MATRFRGLCEHAQALAGDGDADGAIVAFMSAWASAPSAGAQQLALANARLLLEKRHGDGARWRAPLASGRAPRRARPHHELRQY